MKPEAWMALKWTGMTPTLDDLRELSDAATPGPLRVHLSRRAVGPNEGLVSVHGQDCLIYSVHLSAETGEETHKRQFADARLFVACVEYVRALLLSGYRIGG